MGTKQEQGIPDEEMRRTAGDLIQVAVQAFMKIHDVDRKTAQRWREQSWPASKRKLASLGKPANSGP